MKYILDKCDLCEDFQFPADFDESFRSTTEIIRLRYFLRIFRPPVARQLVDFRVSVGRFLVVRVMWAGVSCIVLDFLLRSATICGRLWSK